ENQTAKLVGAELLRGCENRRRQIETAPQLIGKSGGGIPAPGGREELSCIVVLNFGNGAEIGTGIRAVGDIAIPGERPAEYIPGGKYIVKFSQDIIASAVGPCQERVTRCVAQEILRGIAQRE